MVPAAAPKERLHRSGERAVGASLQLPRQALVALQAAAMVEVGEKVMSAAGAAEDPVQPAAVAVDWRAAWLSSPVLRWPGERMLGWTTVLPLSSRQALLFRKLKAGGADMFVCVCARKSLFERVRVRGRVLVAVN